MDRCIRQNTVVEGFHTSLKTLFELHLRVHSARALSSLKPGLLRLSSVATPCDSMAILSGVPSRVWSGSKRFKNAADL